MATSNLEYFSKILKMTPSQNFFPTTAYMHHEILTAIRMKKKIGGNWYHMINSMGKFHQIPLCSFRMSVLTLLPCWEVCEVLLLLRGPSSLITNSCPARHEDVVMISTSDKKN